MKLLVICGPTATGKTSLAFSLAKTFHGELVSADSRQVYRGMDIGTGKEEDPHIRTWCIDVVNPSEAFSVAHFHALASEAIADIHARGKLPIVVGGTGLYIQSLLTPFETAEIPPDQTLRKELSTLPVKELQNRLKKDDAKTWEQLNNSDKNNPRRLMRKIELAMNPKSPNLPKALNHPYDALMIGLTASASTLYTRIDQRVDERLAAGLEQEIQALLADGYTWDMPGMNTLGYKEFADGFSDEAIKKWKYDEHAYARRQLTWFKKMKGIVWFTAPVSAQVVGERVSSWYTGNET